MCGIVGAVASRDITPTLLDGLRRLEYRGYDSAGLAVVNADGALDLRRSVGRVASLKAITEHVAGHVGIAHTRWATHGKPAENNAHPHTSSSQVAVVHNGIIENHQELRSRQRELGFPFSSETDTEVIVHQIDWHMQQGKDLLAAVQTTVQELHGAYGLGVVSKLEPDTLIAARSGSPLLIGIGVNENFIASDMSALIPVSNQYMVMEDGDIAKVTSRSIQIFDRNGDPVERKVIVSNLSDDETELEGYAHYMKKEIHEQTRAITETLEGRLGADSVLELPFGEQARDIFDRTREIKIIACGTSYYAASVARYWFEEFGIKCDVEIASEYRYRKHVVNDGTLFVTISQSGETLDTMAALEMAKGMNYINTLCICNVPESSLVRASDLTIFTHAGREIGVASTKAFTTQLVTLLLVAICLRRRQVGDGRSIDAVETEIVNELRTLPQQIENVLDLEDQIIAMSKYFSNKEHALFLGRGAHFPIAMEGALKLKEISYIHAEAYAAGELKHGPLALIDEDMPVVAVAPNDELLEKLKSNLEEVRARGGKLFVFADAESGLQSDQQGMVLNVAPVNNYIAPILYVVPLQLLAYHVALLKGTDIDKPRNLAKSVTVE
ncbi:glutamine--fructose-6-phosphate aminotransferase [isomerizing] [Arenicella chitinivorans]|uniref:Glutamine--fructose-6-phosphate aminotransferase [isomerizing] n=1 Tax=Arenicella chitinivorans TaxID=1329800 RepID=A0A918S393_9GAMM|nr:glutamine--fructose-6-phosphate transaminase (isomerizing) [Arenicella chitinivorans]GHA18607.1 glutamine--fructose-6-phosphate aminotransferase [isomerizing] [Arenicella chitinivorans]